ncbi:MAG: Mercuric resistance operon regulatory protein [Labilithrix sp.]|nr:Mercuric resistance operon regulatory protein [Labilithrix sp.]
MSWGSSSTRKPAAVSNVRLPIVTIPLSIPASAPALDADALRDDETLMQVGDLARVAGKTVRALHLYEEMDLLKPAGRSKGRYRLYGPEALVRIRWIQKLQDLGFSLTHIKDIVKDVEQHGSASSASKAMGGVRDVYAKKLDETRAQIARLQALEGEIQASLEYLEACASLCDKGKLLPACQCCDHHSGQEVPDLVAGFRG